MSAGNCICIHGYASTCPLHGKQLFVTQSTTNSTLPLVLQTKHIEALCALISKEFGAPEWDIRYRDLEEAKQILDQSLGVVISGI
jgi:hypothetical protein